MFDKFLCEQQHNFNLESLMSDGEYVIQYNSFSYAKAQRMISQLIFKSMTYDLKTKWHKSKMNNHWNKPIVQV